MPASRRLTCKFPFVNKGTTNHWLVIYEHSLWKPDIPLTAVSETQKQEMRKIEKRFRGYALYTRKVVR